ncbi:hypothetical protein ACLOJK_020321 [Asimina triloba]
MEMQFYVFLFFLWLLSSLFLRSAVLSRRPANGDCKTPALPPSPIALPLIGHLYLLGPLAHQSLDALAKRYGPIIHLYLSSFGSTVVVSSPALAREFLKSFDLTFASRPSVVAQKYIGSGDDSLSFTFLPYGTQWKFLKKILMTELFSPRKIGKMARIRQEEIKRFLGGLLQKSRAGEIADLEDMLAVLTNSIICGMTMGVTGVSAADEYRKVVQEHVELSSKLNTVHLLMGSLARLDLLGYGKRLTKANKRFLAMVDRILEEHEQRKKRLKQERKTTKGVVVLEEDGEGAEEEEEEEDLVDILLKISDDEGAEIKLTRHNIRTCLLDISAGGIETSALTMQWALAEILNNPGIFRKVREEIESVVGTKRLVQESDAPNLPYVQAVVKETLRMHPAVPINLRSCRQDCTVGGFFIPKDTNIFINAWSIGRDPEYWDDPHLFRPERFLDSNAAVDFKGQHFQYLPFGSGRRMCPGMPLSLSVMPVTIAAMVQCFDWIQPNGDINATKLNLEERAGLTSHMAKPLCCIPRARCVPFIDQL